MTRPLIIDAEVAAELAIIGASAAVVAGVRLLTEDLPITLGELGGLRYLDDHAYSRYTSGLREDLDAVGAWVEDAERVLDELERDCE